MNRKMNFLLRMGMVACAWVLLVACQPVAAPATNAPATSGGETTSEAATTSSIPDAELVAPGKLTIATTGNATPYTFMTDEGDLAGYDIALCTEIAARLGLEPEFTTLEWAGILPGLAAGRFDLVCTGVGRTEERLASPDFLFSDATIQDGTGMILNADSPDITDWEEVRGMNMGGVRGAYYASDVSTLLDGDVTVTEYPGETEMMLDLENKRIDFGAMGYLVASVRAQENPQFKLGATPFNPVTKGIPVNKNAPTLLEEVNTIIADLAADGTLEAWQVEWFGVPAMPESE